MPVTSIRGVDINYEILGERGPWVALILAVRRPDDVRGLLLWRVTGGQHAAVHLSNQYYTSHIEAAKAGGMAAVCAMEHWTEVIAANPASRAALMAMDPKDFIARM